MKECVKIFKGLGILFLLCVLSSTMALSEDKTKAMDNQTSLTNMTQVNVSENQTSVTNTTNANTSENIASSLNASNVTSITNMTQVNVSENQTAITNTTTVNASENIATSLNASNVTAVNSTASLNILTGTSPTSWEDAVSNVANAIDSMGQKVKFMQVLNLDVKIENGKIAEYEATVLLTY
ncbi:MAG: dodecin domain-containing protein [Methanothrix sp.]